MPKNNPNITSTLNKDFKKSLKRNSFIQDIDKSGHISINFDYKKFPFATTMIDLLIERNFLEKSIELDKLHDYLSLEDMAVDQGQINNVIKSLYETSEEMTNLYHKFMSDVISRYIGVSSYIQKTPTNRFSFPYSSGMSTRDYHNDIMLGHPPEEINIWIPFTDCSLSRSFKILPLEFSLKLLDKYEYNMQSLHHAIWNDNNLLNSFEKNSICVELKLGQALLFDSRCFHASVMNESNFTRVSMDVRLIPVTDYDNLPFTYVGTGRRKSHFIRDDYYLKTAIIS